MASNKKSIKQIDHYFSELEETETIRIQAEKDFIESIQVLHPIPKAEAWLKHVANDIYNYGDQEAAVYLASRGYDYKSIAQKIIIKWREAERRSAEMHYAPSTTTYLSKTGKTRTKKNKQSPELLTLLASMLPDFWYGRDYQELSIDATMLRTVEWLDIGGFDESWNRNAENQYESIVRNGIEAIPASFYLFHMCRSDYGIQLNNKVLKIMLDAIEVPDNRQSDPWRRWLYRIEPPQSVDHFAYAASIVFADEILTPTDIPKLLIDKALNLLQKHQGANGAWKCWATDKNPSIDVTAMAIHALAVKKPRGSELALSKARDWLLSVQNRSGYWYDPGCPDAVYLTVLVLDAIELANGGKTTTAKSLNLSKSQKVKKLDSKNNDRRNKRRSQPKIYVHKGEIIMGDKYIAGNNVGGVQYIGKFNDVITNLHNTGQLDLANALFATKDAILASTNLSDEKKKEHIEILNTLGDEISKPQPNKTLLKMLGDGLLSALKTVPDVTKAAIALAPLLMELKK